MATDFVSALIDAAAADGTLAGAGLETWQHGVDTGDSYPYLVITSIGTKISKRNFGSGQIHEQHLRINVFGGNPDDTAALGALVRAFLESLQAAPLVFDEGRQVDFHQTGEDLVITNRRKPGVEGVTFVWLRSLTWVAKIARDRAS
jgi:hypothetical protein